MDITLMFLLFKIVRSFFDAFKELLNYWGGLGTS